MNERSKWGLATFAEFGKGVWDTVEAGAKDMYNAFAPKSPEELQAEAQVAHDAMVAEYNKAANPVEGVRNVINMYNPLYQGAKHVERSLEATKRGDARTAAREFTAAASMFEVPRGGIGASPGKQHVGKPQAGRALGSKAQQVGNAKEIGVSKSEAVKADSGKPEVKDGAQAPVNKTDVKPGTSQPAAKSTDSKMQKPPQEGSTKTAPGIEGDLTFKATGKGARQYKPTLNVDEYLAVGEKGISPQEAMRRAQDLGSRQFLDFITNQATKRDLIPSRPAPQLPPTSVAENPSSLIARERLGGIKEWDQLSEIIRARTAHRMHGKSPDQVRNILNEAIRKEIRKPTTAPGRVISEALEKMLHIPANKLFKREPVRWGEGPQSSIPHSSSKDSPEPGPKMGTKAEQAPKTPEAKSSAEKLRAETDKSADQPKVENSQAAKPKAEKQPAAQPKVEQPKPKVEQPKVVRPPMPPRRR